MPSKDKLDAETLAPVHSQKFPQRAPHHCRSLVAVIGSGIPLHPAAARPLPLPASPWWLGPPSSMFLLAIVGVLACVVLLLCCLARRQQQMLKAAKTVALLQARSLDAIPMPVYIRSRNLRLVACNAAYSHACGEPHEMLRNASVEACMRLLGVDTALLDMLKRDYRHVMRSGELVTSEYPAVVRGQQLNWRHWIAPMRNESGEIVGIAAGWQDVTDYHNTQNQLADARDRAEAANRAKSTFLASISHDIRTPMNAVMGMLELTLLQPTLPRTARQNLTTALQSAKSLLALIGDLLDLARIEAGKLHLRPGPTALRDLVHEVAGVFAPIATGNGIRVHVRVRTAVAAMHRADPLRLKQILNNLVSNAVRFTRQGRIDIDLRAMPQESGFQWVEFSVRDTGLGIPAHALPTLLDPFVQTHPEFDHRGTGLGLSICRRLVGAMGGSIRIKSEVGQGTLVAVRLPLPVATSTGLCLAGTASSRRPPIAAADASRLPILVVDDQPGNRQLLRHQLEKLGHVVVCAEDGVRALEEIGRQAYKLVICDCNMPRMDGYAFVGRLRAQPGANSRIPVLAYTAGIQAEDQRRASAAGINAVLTKPVGMADLRMALDAHLQAPGLSR
ncbi:ATP-binding protein [Bordetella sp. BOR01]|uniref:hybrid sensor histidine kinase/response regulator n=1 Tax=Bordetella sp. BOR01 TaxID=2854779 RepID=UPI001C44429F|nr:ATP-binding protein [Bordetella sp. BOR01]MBV7483089.1 response regulator [Bordetella sp. BOR01]